MASEKQVSQNEASEVEGPVTDDKVAVATKVNIETWRKIKYLSLKRSMQTGTNYTLSRTTGDLLDKVAESLEEPPSDLVA